jgi:hypothetical protein
MGRAFRTPRTFGVFSGENSSELPPVAVAVVLVRMCRQAVEGVGEVVQGCAEAAACGMVGEMHRSPAF